MKKNQNILSEHEIEISGQQVILKKLKYKGKKRENYANIRNTFSSCPNCLSKMKLDDSNNWECSGDNLKIWESEFYEYKNFNNVEKVKYLESLSNYSKFLDLYDKWEYCLINKEMFTCGYNNDILPIISSSKISIPDPIFTNILEKKLSRKLTEEELYGEKVLYFSNGAIFLEYQTGAKNIRIPWVILPSQETIYVDE